MKCTLDAYQIWPELGHLPWTPEETKRPSAAAPAPTPEARAPLPAEPTRTHQGVREARLWLALSLGLAIGGAGTAIAAWAAAHGATAVVYAETATIGVEHTR